MVVQKRFSFVCWKCHRTYSLLRTVEGDPVLRVKCPYCFAEGVVDLNPYRKNVVTVLRKDIPCRRLRLSPGTFPNRSPPHRLRRSSRDFPDFVEKTGFLNLRLQDMAFANAKSTAYSSVLVKNPVFLAFSTESSQSR